MKISHIIGSFLSISLLLLLGYITVQVALFFSPAFTYVQFQHASIEDDTAWDKARLYVEKLEALVAEDNPINDIAGRFMNYPEISERIRGELYESEHTRQYLSAMSELCSFENFTPYERDSLISRYDYEITLLKSVQNVAAIQQSLLETIEGLRLRSKRVASELNLTLAQRDWSVMSFAHYQTGVLQAFPLFEELSVIQASDWDRLAQALTATSRSSSIDLLQESLAREQDSFQSELLVLQSLLRKYKEASQGLRSVCEERLRQEELQLAAQVRLLKENLSPRGPLARRVLGAI